MEKDLCITCKTEKKDCFLAQGLAKAIACVGYEEDESKKHLQGSICCGTEVVLNKDEYVCICCGMPHKKI